MWNEQGPLELLKNMPQVLTAENLAQIQQVIDNDKFLNSQKLRGDLCGRYAPFCKNCDKTVPKPCAVAYVRMKIKEGMEVQMENIPSETPEEIAEEKAAKKPSQKIRIAIARKK
ncbi:MAG: hypothetical protein NC033_04410 [Clostridiales bacterium]|nr:hypothetical protein [Clostridiales bacterium]